MKTLKTKNLGSLLILFLLISFSGCMTEKRATKKIAQLGIQYPYAGAQYCANSFPVRVEHTQSIEYREGKRDTLWQAEYIDCDTVIGTDRIVKVPYPVLVPSRDTLIFRDSIFSENTKKVEALQKELNNTTLKLYKAENRTKYLLLALAIIVAINAVIIIIKRFF